MPKHPSPPSLPEEPIQYIRPTKGWRLVNWGELVRYKDLLYFFLCQLIP